MPSGLPTIVKLATFGKTTGMELWEVRSQKVTCRLKGLICCSNNTSASGQVWTEYPRLSAVLKNFVHEWEDGVAHL